MKGKQNMEQTVCYCKASQITSKQEVGIKLHLFVLFSFKDKAMQLQHPLRAIPVCNLENQIINNQN